MYVDNTYPPLMKRKVRNIMHRFHHYNNFIYDEIEENRSIVDLLPFNVNSALQIVNLRLKTHKAGGSFNYSSAVAYALRKEGFNCGIISYYEGLNKKHSFAVAYLYCEKLYVCDIIQYIRGVSGIAKCSNIPYDEFQKTKNTTLWLYNIDIIEDSYIYEITNDKSNITIEEFLNLPYYLSTL